MNSRGEFSPSEIERLGKLMIQDSNPTDYPELERFCEWLYETEAHKLTFEQLQNAFMTGQCNIESQHERPNEWSTINPPGWPWTPGGVYSDKKLLCVCSSQFEAVEVCEAHNQMFGILKKDFSFLSETLEGYIRHEREWAGKLATEKKYGLADSRSRFADGIEQALRAVDKAFGRERQWIKDREYIDQPYLMGNNLIGRDDLPNPNLDVVS